MGPAAVKRPNAMMEGPSYTSNDNNLAKELEDALMKYTTPCVDDSKVDQVQPPQVHPPVGQTKEVPYSVDLPKETHAVGDVDITDMNRLGYGELVDGQYNEITESSSSFGDSGSDNDDFGDEALSGSYEDFMLKTRRKKLTPHWRAFIEPIMWRCKWTELQIKNLESQAKKYDKKLAEYSQKKHIQFDNSAFEGLGVKSLPFPEKNFTDKVLKRKMRRRAELTTDLAAHMTNHNLFSYYENKKNITEAALMDKVKVSAGQKVKVEELPGDEFLWAQPGDADDSMEHMLQKIISLESQVGKMKSRVDNVINENARKFSDLENLSLPIISPTSSSQNTTPSNGSKMIIGNDVSSQFVTDHYVGDALMRGTASTSHENLTGSDNLARFADALKNGKDDIVYTKKVKLEKISQPIERHLTPSDEFGGSGDQLEEESDTPMDSRPLPKTRSGARHTATPPKNDVRRGKRRTCVGRGNPRFS